MEALKLRLALRRASSSPMNVPWPPAAPPPSSEFDAADAALNDETDALEPQFATTAGTFVTDFRNARMIVDSGHGKAKAKPAPPAPPSMPPAK